MITREEFFKGRDLKYPQDMTAEIESNAAVTIERGNLLLQRYSEATGDNHRRSCNSGWRPPSLNAATPGAALKSKHLKGLAEDISDDDGSLDAWCMSEEGIRALEDLGLWIEHPDATPRWCHIQTVPYGSWQPGKPRYFRP